MRLGQSSCGLLACPNRICLHMAQVPEWCTGIPVLVCWVAMAMFHMAAIGFALFLLVCVRAHAHIHTVHVYHTCMCVMICVYDIYDIYHTFT